MHDTGALTAALTACQSVTPDDAGCMELITAELAPCGCKAEQLDFGHTRNLFMRHGTQAPLLVFLGHTDVVPTGPEADWKYPPFEATIDNGTMYGRGAAAKKRGVAAMVTDLALFSHSHPDHPGSITLLMTTV